MRTLATEQLVASGRASLVPRLLLELRLPGADTLILNLSDQYLQAQAVTVLNTPGINASPDIDKVPNGAFATSVDPWVDEDQNGGVSDWTSTGGGRMSLQATAVTQLARRSIVLSTLPGVTYTLSITATEIASAGTPLTGLGIVAYTRSLAGPILQDSFAATGAGSGGGTRTYQIVPTEDGIYLAFSVGWDGSADHHWHIDNVSLVGEGTPAVPPTYREVEIPEHLPLVQSWGALRAVLNALDSGGAPPTFDVTLFNTLPVGGRARLSDLLRSVHNAAAAYEFAGAPVTLKLGLGRLDAAGRWVATMEPLTLGVFFLEEPTDIDEHLFTIRMRAEDGYLDRRQPLTRITRARFPYAAAEVVEQVIRVPIGSLRRVPGQAVKAGAVLQLDGDITNVVATITFKDASRLDASGTVLIGTELITYTGKTGHSITGCTRGALTTGSSAHDDGDEAFQVLDEYVYVFGEGTDPYRIGALSAAYINDVIASGLTLSPHNAAVLSGKFLATAVIPVASVRDFHLIPLGATTLATSPPHTNSTVAASGQDGYTIIFPTLPPNVDPNQECTIVIEARLTRTGGTAASRHDVQWRDSSIDPDSPTSGPNIKLADIPDDGTDVSLSFTRSNWPTGGQFVELTWEGIGAGTMATRIGSAYISVRAAGAGSQSTADHVIGRVAADLEGIRDDGGGTLTGAASLLLTNPADVFRFILTKLYGVPASRLGASWAAARAAVAGASYRWDFLLGFDGPPRLTELQGKAEQARCELVIDGGLWELRFIPEAPPADLTFDYDVDLAAALPARVRRTEDTQRFNVVVASGQRDYATGGYRYAAEASDLAQPGFTERTELLLTCDLVQEPAVLEAIAAWKLREVKRQRFVLELGTFPDAPAGADQRALALQRCDHVAIANHPVLAAHGGSALVCRIKEKAYDLGADYPLGIRLAAVEVGA